MNLIGDIAAIRHPMPLPGLVTLADLYPDACEQVERHRTEGMQHLQTAGEGLAVDPLLLALQEARARRKAPGA